MHLLNTFLHYKNTCVTMGSGRISEIVVLEKLSQPDKYMVSRFRLVEIKIAMQIDLILKTVKICFPIPTLIGLFNIKSDIGVCFVFLLIKM